MSDRLLTRAQVKERTGLGSTTLWRFEREGRFPPRRQIGPGRVGWLESEVAAWMERLPAVESEAP